MAKYAPIEVSVVVSRPMIRTASSIDVQALLLEQVRMGALLGRLSTVRIGQRRCEAL